MERWRDLLPLLLMERKDGEELYRFFGVEQKKEFPPKISELVQV